MRWRECRWVCQCVCVCVCVCACARVGLSVCACVMALAVSLGPRCGAGGAAVPAPEGYSEYSHGELEGYSEYSHRGRGRRGRACAVRTVTGGGIRRNPGLTVGHMLPAILQRN